MPSKIETGIDKFVEEIQKRGKLTFKEAASVLGISEEKVEEWAKLLSQHKEETGIEIKYPAFGEPEIVATELKKEVAVKEKIEEIKEGKDELEDILEKYTEGKIPEAIEKAKVGGPAKKPEEEKETPKAVERGVAEKEVQEVEQRLGEIKQVEAVIEKLEKVASDIEKEVEHAESEEKELEKNIQDAKHRLSTLKKAIFLLVDAMKKKVEDAKKTEMGIHVIRSMKEDLKRIEVEIKSVESQTKKYEQSKIKIKLLKTLEGVLQGGKKSRR